MPLTASGFTVRTEQEIFDDIAAELRDKIDPNLNLSASSAMGAFVAIVASMIAEEEEVAASVYAAQFPASASGSSLDAVASITGTVRKAPTSAKTTLRLTFTAAATVPAGSIVAQAGNETLRFVTDADATSPGAGTVDVTATAENTGPLGVADSTLTVIVTPVANWDSVTNPAGFYTEGTDLETDDALRLRRQQEIQRSGGSTVDAIEADISALDGVLSITVTENTTAATDGDGRPAHSFEALVWDGPTPAADDDEIAQAIYDQKPAGILSYSATADSGTAVKADLTTTTVGFSRASAEPIEIEVTVSTDATYPIDGDTQIEEALASLTYLPGEDVIRTELYAVIFGIQGVTDVTTLLIDTVAGGVPAAANVVIGVRDVATIDTGDITVTS